MTANNKTLQRSHIINTYSIVAHDPATGQVGVAVQTHQIGVGNRVCWAKPGVGAVATQSLVNVSYGPQGLRLLAEGKTPQQAINLLTAADDRAFHRQLGIVSADGRAAAFTGELCIANAGHHAGDGYTVHANMMANNTVISAMRQGYEITPGDLAARLMGALVAAEDEGGDIRGMQSAALLIVPPGGDDVPEWATVYDLRVDEHARPLDELARMVVMQRASLLASEAEAAFHDGERDRAMSLWAQARELSPEQEELTFWQVMTLADEGNDIEGAANLFNSVFATRSDRDQWLQLILRLEEARLVQREGAAQALVDAIRA